MSFYPRQVDEIAANTFSPFQRLGEGISGGLTEGLDSFKIGAQGAVEGAQTQLGQSVTETIGGPIQVVSTCRDIACIDSLRFGRQRKRWLKTPNLFERNWKPRC